MLEEEGAAHQTDRSLGRSHRGHPSPRERKLLPAPGCCSLWGWEVSFEARDFSSLASEAGTNLFLVCPGVMKAREALGGVMETLLSQNSQL